MSINLHIENLILDGIGLSAHRSKELKAAVEIAIKKKIRDQGIWSTLQLHHDHESIRGGSILVEKHCKSETLGQKIGNAVYQSIKK